MNWWKKSWMDLVEVVWVEGKWRKTQWSLMMRRGG
jgi:hypothetical protein